LGQRQSEPFKIIIEEQRSTRLEDKLYWELKQVKDQSEEQRNVWLQDIRQRGKERTTNESEEKRNMRLKDMLQQE